MAKDFQRVVSTGVAWARQVEETETVVASYGTVTAYPSDWIVQQEIAGASNTFIVADIDFQNDWVMPSAAVRDDGTSASGTDPHPEPKGEGSEAPPTEPAPPAESAPTPAPETAPAAAPEPAPAAAPEPAPAAAPVPAPAPAPDVVNPVPADAVPVPDTGKHESPEEAAALVDATTPADTTIPAKVKEVPAPAV